VIDSLNRHMISFTCLQSWLIVHALFCFALFFADKLLPAWELNEVCISAQPAIHP